MFAEEQASLLCQKAMFSFKKIQIDQRDIVTGKDMREHTSGHIVVSKDEQTKTLTEQKYAPDQ